MNRYDWNILEINDDRIVGHYLTRDTKLYKILCFDCVFSAAIGAFGHADVEKNELIPENDFFVPGRTFEIRMVHSNFPSEYAVYIVCG